MSPTSLLFGDIFLYDNGEYVFLVATTDQIFAAKILDKDLTEEIERSYKNALSKNKECALRLTLYCYVILTTKEVKDRMANFVKTDGYSADKIIRRLPFSLNENDKRDILEEISQSHSIPLGLKELMSEMQL